MRFNRQNGSDSPARRVLVVADWAVDPRVVVTACAARIEHGAQDCALLVPAWLHGLDWMGDPGASAPCARRQLDDIGVLAGAAGLAFATARTGDPDVITAICDVLADWPADEILLCAPAHRLLAHPFDLLHRVRRVTGLAVRHADLPRADGHCAEYRQAA